jgi:toxin ParE1/3/4
MQLRWSVEAADDFESAILRILKDNPTAAHRVAQVVYDTIGSLPAFPNRGRTGKVEGTRELVIAGLPFVVVYRIKEEFIEIARVIHGAQEWPPRM